MNTDWGDFSAYQSSGIQYTGHDLRAAFSWNTQIPDFEEINRQISEMEYGDSTGRLVGVLAKTQALNGFTWGDGGPV